MCILGDPRRRGEHYYNTEDVPRSITSSVLLFDSYCLDIGIMKLKLDRHVNGSLGIMAKHADGGYVYNFEIFHECLLPKSDGRPRVQVRGDRGEDDERLYYVTLLDRHRGS